VSCNDGEGIRYRACFISTPATGYSLHLFLISAIGYMYSRNEVREPQCNAYLQTNIALSTQLPPPFQSRSNSTCASRPHIRSRGRNGGKGKVGNHVRSPQAPPVACPHEADLNVNLDLRSFSLRDPEIVPDKTIKLSKIGSDGSKMHSLVN
jgi:hypothetical protein